jgi:pimeloyl-ACP methyl ester carboxylesterase
MRLLASDTAALLDALAIRRAHVAGLSLGSTVAQELALLRPDLVATLQLHGTWGHSDPAFRYAIETMRYPLLLGDRAGFVRTALAWILSPTFLNDDAAREGLLAAILGSPHPASTEGILGQIHADLTHESLDRLGAIHCPTLVTAGEVDIQVPPRLGRDVHRAIPGAEWHLFTGPRASHLACLEMSAEFNRVTLEFLARHPIGR